MSDYQRRRPAGTDRSGTDWRFGTGWRFGPAPAGSDQPDFDDSGFAAVTLPHTVTPLSWQDWDPSAWERVWAYRNRFDAPRGTDGMRVFLDFSAAMTRATVTLNGVQVADHLGRYLPFSAEISGPLRPRGNVLAVRLDSTFNLNVPPDRPAGPARGAARSGASWSAPAAASSPGAARPGAASAPRRTWASARCGCRAASRRWRPRTGHCGRTYTAFPQAVIRRS
jgi:hypothetical protein